MPCALQILDRLTDIIARTTSSRDGHQFNLILLTLLLLNTRYHYMQQQQKPRKRGGRPLTTIVLSCLALATVLFCQLPLLFSSTSLNSSQDAQAPASSELTLTSTLTSNCPVPTSSVKEEEDCSKNFFELAFKIGTDKVTTHASNMHMSYIFLRCVIRQ